MTHRRRLPFLLALVLAALAGRVSAADSAPTGWDAVPGILARIKAPTFPDRDFPITDFGARTGAANNGDALRRAIAACHAAGGGRVVVPAGRFVSGAIHLKSNVNLHLAEGATLAFSTDPADYLPVVLSRYEGVECYNYSPLIYAYQQENIAITGSGTLDGQAGLDNWLGWHDRARGLPTKSQVSVERLYRMGQDGVPASERIFGPGWHLRPTLIHFNRCANVLVEGVSMRRLPFWNFNPVFCRNVTMRGVKVDSHNANSNGCTPDSSRDVLIEDCVFDTQDDCIDIKSGRNNDGRRVNVPVANIIIRNVEFRRGAGVAIGSEISAGAHNIFIEDCRFEGTARVLRVKSNSVRGGVIENVFLRNLTAANLRKEAIGITFFYQEGDAGDFLPTVRNITVENLNCHVARSVFVVMGFERAPIRGLTVRDSRFEGMRHADVLRHVQGLVLDNVLVNTDVPFDQWGTVIDPPTEAP